MRLRSIQEQGTLVGDLANVANIGVLAHRMPDIEQVDMPESFAYRVDWSDGNGSCIDSGRTGAAWETERLMYAGHRADGFDFWGYITPDGSPRVLAGCRFFTMAEARQHWAGSNRSTQTFSFLDAISRWAQEKTEAKALDQKPMTATEAHAAMDAAAALAAPSPTVDLATVYQFMGPVLGDMFRNWVGYHKSIGIPAYENVMVLPIKVQNERA